VIFHEQMRNATGALTPEFDEFTKATAFNDPDSWDFNVTVYDENDLVQSQGESMYNEFGIDRYTELTVSGFAAGNAPPTLTPTQLTSSNTEVTYRANCDHAVIVDINDLVGPGPLVTRDTIAVMNTDDGGANGDISVPGITNNSM